MDDTAYMERLRTTGRNDPCPCGSGKKYKKCHLNEDETKRHEDAVKQEELREAQIEKDQEVEESEETHDEESHKKQHQGPNWMGPHHSAKGGKVPNTANLPRRGAK